MATAAAAPGSQKKSKKGVVEEKNSFSEEEEEEEEGLGKSLKLPANLVRNLLSSPHSRAMRVFQK